MAGARAPGTKPPNKDVTDRDIVTVTFRTNAPAYTRRHGNRWQMPAGHSCMSSGNISRYDGQTQTLIPSGA